MPVDLDSPTWTSASWVDPGIGDPNTVAKQFYMPPPSTYMSGKSMNASYQSRYEAAKYLYTRTGVKELQLNGVDLAALLADYAQTLYTQLVDARRREEEAVKYLTRPIVLVNSARRFREDQW